MKSIDVRTYKIQIHGQLEEEDIHATSPLRFTIEQVERTNTTITLEADQSGIIGVIRHLHGMGLTLISMICSIENPPKNCSIPSGDEQE